MKKIHKMCSFGLFQINEKSAHNVQVYFIPKVEITLKLLNCYVSTFELTTWRVGFKFEACSRVASMGVNTLLTFKIIDWWKEKFKFLVQAPAQRKFFNFYNASTWCN
jgi:hypothetical protein